MTADQLRSIFDETGPDFSAEYCDAVTPDALDPEAIERFRRMWSRESGNDALARLSQRQLLEDAELVHEDRVTYAGLILLGSAKALDRHLAQAEVVFEYRVSKARVDFQQRREYRSGFLLLEDALWREVNLRNEVHSYQDGLARWNISSFNEAVVREAILNAICHRDYRQPGSIFVRQWPEKMEIVSPGGFPDGINSRNLVWRQHHRNRRIAESLSRCGLVERSGQGADRMVGLCIREGKLPPDYSDSDRYQVSVALDGRIRDEGFVVFLDRISEIEELDVDELLVLDAVHRDAEIPSRARGAVDSLLERRALKQSHQQITLNLERQSRASVRLGERIGLTIHSFSGPLQSDATPRNATLDLSRHFEARSIKDRKLWLSEIYPRLRDFFASNVSPSRTLRLELAAHATIAWLSGYCLDAKSGLNVEIRQSSETWSPREGSVGDGPFWERHGDQELDPDAPDVALAVSVTHPVGDDVRTYLDEADRGVKRIIGLSLRPAPGLSGVQNGAHALCLAQDLIQVAQTRSAAERRGRIHLFIAAPNAFIFILGQLARSLGRSVFYEYSFGEGRIGAYQPSINLPPG